MLTNGVSVGLAPILSVICIVRGRKIKKPLRAPKGHTRTEKTSAVPPCFPPKRALCRVPTHSLQGNGCNPLRIYPHAPRPMRQAVGCGALSASPLSVSSCFADSSASSLWVYYTPVFPPLSRGVRQKREIFFRLSPLSPFSLVVFHKSLRFSLCIMTNFGGTIDFFFPLGYNKGSFSR